MSPSPLKYWYCAADFANLALDVDEYAAPDRLWILPLSNTVPSSGAGDVNSLMLMVTRELAAHLREAVRRAHDVAKREGFGLAVGDAYRHGPEVLYTLTLPASTSDELIEHVSLCGRKNEERL